MSKLRVSLVVSDDLDYGLDLADALDKAGMDVTLRLSQRHLAAYLGQPASSPDLLLAALYDKGLLPRAVEALLFCFPRIRDLRSLSVALKLRDAIYRDQPNVVHILMGPGELWISILACLIRKLPVASTMIIPQPNLGEQLPTRVLWLIAKLLALGSDMVLVNGADQVEIVHRLYSVSAKKVIYVPLIPRAVAAKWANGYASEQAGTVLFAGKAQPRKGLEYLVRAQPFISEYVPNARIILAAHGEELERCRAFIADESKFEIRDGFLTSSEMAEYFQKTSLVALPYLTASTSGLLTTAYVFGKPVIATRIGALPEYVQEGKTGLLVPPADAQSLAEAIVRLLTDNPLRAQMSRNALEWVCREQEKVVAMTIQAYEAAQSNFNKERTL
jgi:glycosyltransferase involved in cell wall biosynthesis